MLKLPASVGHDIDAMKNSSRPPPLKRPTLINESRQNLPVCSMEQEIIELVSGNKNDCIILCGETGSGKSTQTPQFIYEAGFSLNSSTSNFGNPLLIGVTQPRRVAAISTAKRVANEMGAGDGKTIKPNSLVAYQTRYERAGFGDATHVKFMTDGILLAEVQEGERGKRASLDKVEKYIRATTKPTQIALGADLLLRRYGVIILDEAHERNLNTDVLLGLLSASIPLRRQAYEQDKSLPPLKLIIMSATLRVTDFTENPKLFAHGRVPPVVKVPARQFPVTVHHNKKTELDDYETLAFNKICSIHKKLPEGGILVFLTGKQEIVDMYKRLNNALATKKARRGGGNGKGKGNFVEVKTDATSKINAGDCFLKEMDDDEVDACVFDENDNDNDNDSDSDEEDNAEDNSDLSTSGPVHILPLYSMLSQEEQAKVFLPSPKNHRLIVLATNIAETSITIPNIVYVVDTGRQKVSE